MDSLYYSASAKGTESSPPPLLIASTIRAFVEQQQYFFDMLWRKAIPVKQRIKEIEEGLKREYIETIQDPEEIQNLVSNLDKSIQTKVTTIVVDNELSLVIELKDDTQLNSNEAIGLATYSNSESTVLSYASIFEALWIQSSEIII